MKRVYITTIVTALLMLAIFGTAFSAWESKPETDVLKVGFIYENDESTPYTYNFMLAQYALERQFPGQVQTYAFSNVRENETLEPVHELVRRGCTLIFSNSYSDQFVQAAETYPDVQFCQNSYNSADHKRYPANYHTFNGAIYQARYVTGIAAGMKLRDWIDSRVIEPGEALVGYVGAFPTVEVISGYTAFLLGVRSVAPEATMRVRYTGSWSSFKKEKACAEALIDEGCLVIGQHTDTIGPAVACEMAGADRRVIHVGYNQDMVDIAPNTSLISCRVNWTPYVVGAAQAVLDRKPIEKAVEGSVHDSDICAGFDLGWVQVLDLNKQIAAFGTQEKLDKAVEALRRGTLEVYRGDYTGVDPINPSDTCDLKLGYQENEKNSWPTFHYILNDVITVE